MAEEARIVTVEDIRRLTSRQQEVLSAVCMGDDDQHRAILNRLVRMGLLEEYRDPRRGNSYWRVPIAVHMAWCAWCDEIVEGGGDG